MPTLRPSRILEPRIEKESAAARARRLSAALRRTVALAWRRAPGFRRSMKEAGLRPADVRGLDDLAKLPVLRKDALPAMQAADPPFGGLAGVAPGRLARIFMSPGPMYDPQGDALDFWRFRHALAATGFRAGEIAHIAASYHLTPMGFMLEEGARALGCAVIPAGVGQTELQIKVAHQLGATAYAGTPSFLHVLLSRAREAGTPLSLEVAHVVAEMLPESLRAELENEFGVRVLQSYGTADLGCLAYECPHKGGWHVHPGAIVEVLDLESRTPAEPGLPGEIVATIFEEAYPLVRFATGDLSSMAPAGRCPCGRTAPKLSGLLGRVGDGVKVKGMFVRASQIGEALRRFPEVVRWRAVVERVEHQDQLTYSVELGAPTVDPEALAARIADALREEIKVRGRVEVVAAGAIPEGARKIDDRRVWK